MICSNYYTSFSLGFWVNLDLKRVGNLEYVKKNRNFLFWLEFFQNVLVVLIVDSVF